MSHNYQKILNSANYVSYLFDHGNKCLCCRCDYILFSAASLINTKRQAMAKIVKLMMFSIKPIKFKQTSKKYWCASVINSLVVISMHFNLHGLTIKILYKTFGLFLLQSMTVARGEAGVPQYFFLFLLFILRQDYSVTLSSR